MSIRLSTNRYRLVVPFVLGWLLFGCTSLRFTYNQLDWTIPVYAGRYVSLTPQQDKGLDRAVGDFLYWHCSSQIPLYINVFRDWQTLAGGKPIAYSQLWLYVEQLQGYWTAMAAQAAKNLTPLVLTLTDTQVEEIFANLSEKNDDFREEYVSDEPEDIEHTLYKLMLDRLETWLDDLEPQQQRWVKEWSQQARLWQESRLQTRLAWQAALRQSWQHHADTALFGEKFTALMIHPEQSWPTDYERKKRQQQEVFVHLLEKLLNNLTIQQQQFLQKRLRDSTADLAALSCMPFTVAHLESQVFASNRDF